MTCPSDNSLPTDVLGGVVKLQIPNLPTDVPVKIQIPGLPTDVLGGVVKLQIPGLPIGLQAVALTPPHLVGRVLESGGLVPILLGTGLEIAGGALTLAVNIGDLIDVDVGDKANNSLLFFSASQNKFITSSAITTSTIIDGGNF